jgi:hypothetical protein
MKPATHDMKTGRTTKGSYLHQGVVPDMLRYV